MITAEKKCYTYGVLISGIKSDYNKDNEDFIIESVVVTCKHGHKNTVQVMEDNGLD